jgi:benzoate-CoA ligase family protein
MTQGIIDAVPRINPGSTEIGFAIPETYNASRILFDNLSSGRGDRPAVTGPGGTRSYAEVCAAACRWGHGLASLGLTRGDRVLMFLDDTPDYPAAFFGAVRAGFVPILVNTLTPPDLLQFYLSDSDATVAIAAGAYCHLFDAGALAGTKMHTLIVANGEYAGHPLVKTIEAGDWLAGFPDMLAEAATLRDEMAFWMYSSGSTGRPKGVVHLQHDMAYCELAYARNVLKLTPEDICFSVPKIFFAYGFGNSITFPFAAGATSLLLPGQPKAEAIFDAIACFRPTVFFGLPTLYTALTKAGGAAVADLSSLRLAISAAETLSSDVFSSWKTLTGLEIVEGLGSTEVLHIYLSNRPDSKKLGSAGLRVPGYEISLKNVDGHEAAPGEDGVLWVRGDSCTPSYWNSSAKTAETIRDGGWIDTKDRFIRDSDGYYFFRGRADDLIKVSGQWVYPLEVELCLAEHPAVRECAVLAVELPGGGMALRSIVVMNSGDFDANATVKELQAFVKARLLPHKYPREVIFAEDLPKTGTGKIDRQALRKRYA